MNDTVVRHMIAAIATLVTTLAYFAGYFSGKSGWWWTVFAVVIIYGAIYQIVDAGGK